MTTMTITEFLLARIGEWEQMAQDVLNADFSDGRWRWLLHGPPPYRSALVNDRDAVVLPSKNDDVFPSRAVADHIAHHDPARVLAQCEAMRLTVELHEHHRSQAAAYRSPRWRDAMNEQDEQEWRKAEARLGATEPAVRASAAIWSDHPDYDEAWRP